MSSEKQKCQIESLRKQHRQVAEIRNGLQGRVPIPRTFLGIFFAPQISVLTLLKGTRATNERTIKSTDYELDEAIEYGECVSKKVAVHLFKILARQQNRSSDKNDKRAERHQEHKTGEVRRRHRRSQ